MTVSISIQYACSSSSRISVRFSAFSGARMPSPVVVAMSLLLPLGSTVTLPAAARAERRELLRDPPGRGRGRGRGRGAARARARRVLRRDLRADRRAAGGRRRGADGAPLSRDPGRGVRATAARAAAVHAAPAAHGGPPPPGHGRVAAVERPFPPGDYDVVVVGS